MAEKKKSHKFTETHIKHHKDGSHSVHHEHEDGKSHEDYAVGDHDGMIDGLMHFTGEPNEGEAEAVAGQGAGPGALPMPQGEKATV